MVRCRRRHDSDGPRRLPQDAAQEVSVGAVQQAVTKGVASIHDVKLANAAAADALETKIRATSLLTGVGTGAPRWSTSKHDGPAGARVAEDPAEDLRAALPGSQSGRVDRSHRRRRCGCRARGRPRHVAQLGSAAAPRAVELDRSGRTCFSDRGLERQTDRERGLDRRNGSRRRGGCLAIPARLA